jgi:hypothetical protein
MLHALVCTLALMLSTGCAGSLFAQGERMPGTIAYSEAADVQQGMAPLIRTTRGAGLVVGIRVPFDLGRATSAQNTADTDSPLMSALLGSNLGGFVAMQQRASRPKSLGDVHAKLAMRGSL